MAILSLQARLGLDSTGFKNGLASATAAAENFGTKLSRRLGQAFGVGAVFLAFRELRAIVTDIGKNADAAQAEFAKIGHALSPEDVELLKTYARHWEELGIKARFFSAVVASGVAGVHETGASVFENLGRYIAAAAAFLNPFGDREEARARFEEIANAKRAREGGLTLGRGEDPEALFEAARAARIAREQIAAQAWQATQDRILQLEQEAANLEEKTRISKLTTAERLLELTKERKELELLLSRQFGINEGEGVDQSEAAFARRKRLAEINAEAAGLEGKGGLTPIPNDLGRIGAFAGAAAQGGIPQKLDIHTRVLQSIDRKLSGELKFKEGVQ